MSQAIEAAVMRMLAPGTLAIGPCDKREGGLGRDSTMVRKLESAEHHALAETKPWPDTDRGARL